MQRQVVSSSNVLSVGYDPKTATLEVEFHGGSIYEYYNVPEAVYEGLLSAASIGGYLNDQVKGRYQYQRIA